MFQIFILVFTITFKISFWLFGRFFALIGAGIGVAIGNAQARAKNPEFAKSQDKAKLASESVHYDNRYDPWC